MPLFTLLGLYNIYNIHRHFQAQNFALAVNAVLLLAYNISYAVIALRSEKPWLKRIERKNIILAISLILVTALTSNPWLLTILST